LRKKFKDPITNDDFLVLTQGQTAGAAPGTAGSASATPGAATADGRGGLATQRGTTQPSAPPQQSVGGPGGRGAGMIGVVSKSKAESIRIYNGRTHYNEWGFVYTPTTQAPAGVPGQPGQRQGGPGQRTGGPGGPGTGPAIGPTTPFSPFGP